MILWLVWSLNEHNDLYDHICYVPNILKWPYISI